MKSQHQFLQRRLFGWGDKRSVVNQNDAQQILIAPKAASAQKQGHAA